MRLFLDYRITGADSLNAIYSGRHWSNRKRYKDMVRDLVTVSMIAQGIKPNPMTRPAEVRIVYPVDGIDIDNHAYFAKCVIDALKGMVIRDDSPRWLKRITQGFDENRKEIMVEVNEL